MELLAVIAPGLPQSGWARDLPGSAHVLNQALFLSLLNLASSGLPNLPQPVPLPPVNLQTMVFSTSTVRPGSTARSDLAAGSGTG